MSSREAHRLFVLGLAKSREIEARQRGRKPTLERRATAVARARAWEAGLRDEVTLRRELRELP